MIYHVLTEAEPFSERDGGAISRWVANVVRDDAQACVVYGRADQTWRYPRNQLFQITALYWYYRALRASRGRFPWSLRLFVCRFIFAKLAERCKAGDIVYIHNRPELVSVLTDLLGKKSVRVVLHMHNSHLVNYPLSIVSRANADLTLFCSAFLEHEARERLPRLRPTAVIANGADRQLFFPDRTGKAAAAGIPVVLFVGRLVPEKGAHVFVAALHIVARRGVEVSGRIIGTAGFGSTAETPYTTKLRADAGSIVEFLPFATGEQLAAEYRRAAIFCSPSVWNEAFGMVNVEAMASGLPVIATRVGGVPEIFSNGGAILVEPDSAVALADAICTLASDRTLRQRLAAEGHHAFCERFDWDVVRKRYRELVAQVASPS